MIATTSKRSSTRGWSGSSSGSGSSGSGSSRVGRRMQQQGQQELEDDNPTWPEEVLKAVFPLLAGQDLGACMCVCKRWRDVASDDYLWKQLCARRWPSVLCSSSTSSSSTGGSTGTQQQLQLQQKKGPMMAAGGASRPYFSLFSSFCKRARKQRMPLPKLRFEDLDFYVDIWCDSKPLYSTVVHGPLVLSRILNPPEGISQALQDHLMNESYKLTVPVSPSFSVKLSETPKVSMLVRRRDDQRVACIMDMSSFDYLDGHGNLAHAFEYLQISPLYPFVSPIRAWVALLLLDSAEKEGQEVFGIELDFVDAANSEREVLCLLEILDWKSIS
ncbi:unnamed protein product [Calypogeia fissa]